MIETLHWILGTLMIFGSIGVIAAKRPVYSSLAFLLTLMTLGSLYLLLSADFIAVMQVLVYAGAILVVFIFVMVLFQDAHAEIGKNAQQSYWPLLAIAIVAMISALFFLGSHLADLKWAPTEVSKDFGHVEVLGKALYLDFFFPFEAVIMLFLIAVVGSLYIAKRVK